MGIGVDRLATSDLRLAYYPFPLFLLTPKAMGEKSTLYEF